MLSQLRIVYEEDGYPRELMTEADMVSAVHQGYLTPDSDVTVYGFGSAPEVRKAGSVVELQQLFAKRPEPESPDEPLTKEGEPGVGTKSEIKPARSRKSATRNVVTSKDTYDYNRYHVSQDDKSISGVPSDARDMPGRYKPDRNSRFGLGATLVGVIFVLYALGQCSTAPSEPSDGKPSASSNYVESSSEVPDYTATSDTLTANALGSSNDTTSIDWGLEPDDSEEQAGSETAIQSSDSGYGSGAAPPSPSVAPDQKRIDEVQPAPDDNGPDQQWIDEVLDRNKRAPPPGTRSLPPSAPPDPLQPRPDPSQR